MGVNNFGLFFTRDNTVIRLPVNPEKLPVARETENGEYNVLGIGPIMVPRTPNQREVTISSFFPGRVFSGVLTAGQFQPPEFYIQFFESAMNDRVPILYTPVRYYENGEPFMTGDTGFQVLVTQFQTEERGGETGDFYCKLTLTEYRDYSPQTMQVKQESAGAPATATTAPARETPKGQLVVGATCVANGPYYYTSYGDEPHGNGRGRTVKVSRMVDAARAYPVHITTEAGGALGWIKKESLQVVSST
uniref:Tail assembly protein n=1 Tax=Siphoviridae sp. ctvok7 TaxID=2827596 RepID=A0A8S5LL69_9CAUD|nr:MAG TPA: tail assembly protein [Siphoviridae sp. ctvok7]